MLQRKLGALIMSWRMVIMESNALNPFLVSIKTMKKRASSRSRAALILLLSSAIAF